MSSSGCSDAQMTDCLRNLGASAVYSAGKFVISEKDWASLVCQDDFVIKAIRKLKPAQAWRGVPKNQNLVRDPFLEACRAAELRLPSRTVEARWKEAMTAAADTTDTELQSFRTRLLGSVLHHTGVELSADELGVFLGGSTIQAVLKRRFQESSCVNKGRTPKQKILAHGDHDSGHAQRQKVIPPDRVRTVSPNRSADKKEKILQSIDNRLDTANRLKALSMQDDMRRMGEDLADQLFGG